MLDTMDDCERASDMKGWVANEDPPCYKERLVLLFHFYLLFFLTHHFPVLHHYPVGCCHT